MKKEIKRLKVASVLHKAISNVLMEGKFFSKKIVISRVELSKDLGSAHIYIILSSLNNSTFSFISIENKYKDALHEGNHSIDYIVNEINKFAGSIRKSVLNHVNLRFTPKLIFKPDLSFDNFIEVNKILHIHSD